MRFFLNHRGQGLATVRAIAPPCTLVLYYYPIHLQMKGLCRIKEASGSGLVSSLFCVSLWEEDFEFFSDESMDDQVIENSAGWIRKSS